jgi:SAM-dependent methyltransferase
MHTRSLDLGCGAAPKNFFSATEVYGVDLFRSGVPNVVQADLTVDNIPFSDEFFDYVTAHDFIEHVPRLVYVPHRRSAFIELMNEIWRVLKDGGKFLSVTPSYPQLAAFSDPTHVNFITEHTFPQYFDDKNRWARTYGFNGAFKIELQQQNGPHLISILEKITA